MSGTSDIYFSSGDWKSAVSAMAVGIIPYCPSASTEKPQDCSLINSFCYCLSVPLYVFKWEETKEARKEGKEHLTENWDYFDQCILMY